LQEAFLDIISPILHSIALNDFNLEYLVVCHVGG
jgi:hypothetical protein